MRQAAGWLTSAGISLLDIKLGIRMLVKYPRLTAVSCFAIAIGIAIAAGFFEFRNDLMPSSLPLTDGGRIVSVRNWDVPSGRAEYRTSMDYRVWRSQVRSLETIGAYRIAERNLITTDGIAEPVRVAVITASAFEFADAPPILGRPLVESDERVGATPVAVIGYHLWRTRFAEDSALVGRTVQLGADRRTIVGVMPDGFLFPVYDNLWVPLSAHELVEEPRQGPAVRVFGRLSAEFSIAQSQAEMAAIGSRLAREYPETHEHLRTQVMPYTFSFVDPALVDGSPAVLALQAFFILILVIASINVAALVFSRTAMRETEFAVRAALGASRRRILTQLFVEALVLALVGAAVGLPISKWGVNKLWAGVAESEGPLPFWLDSSLSPSTVAFVVSLAFLTAGIAGLVPALRVTGRRTGGWLQRHRSGSAARFGGPSTAVIITQVAGSVGLLTFAFAIGTEALRYDVDDIGIAASDEILTVRLQLDREDVAYEGGDSVRTAFANRYEAIYDELAHRVVAEPEVQQMTFGNALPGMNHRNAAVEVDGLTALDSTALERVYLARVGAGFFDALNVPLVSGRSFTPSDVEVDGRVTIVNRSFVTQVLDDRNPLGRHVRQRGSMDGDPGPWYEIIGVVEDLGMNPNNPNRAPGMYYPVAAGAAYPIRMAMRFEQNAQSFAPKLRRIALAVDPALRLDEVRPLAELGEAEAKARRFGAFVITVVSAMILLLSATGIHALMSFTVTRRTREIGIRTALGARPRQVLTAILSRGVAQLIAGVVFGILVIVLFDGLGILDEGEYGPLAAVSAVLLLSGVGACIVPALRVLRIQPTEALRES
jgi:predicted permease